MRVLVLFILLALSSYRPPAAWGAEVLILQSNRSPVYTEALRGFSDALKDADHTLVLTDYAEIDVQRIVREERPRLVLAVGDRALAACGKIREVPVLTMLSLSLNLKKQSPDNIGGIAMAIAPEQYLKLFNSLGAKRIGVLYDPEKTGHYMKRVVQNARQSGLNIMAEPVKDPRDLQAKLEKLKGNVDALWMLPDSTVVTTVNLEALILFSMTHNVPTVTFTSHYLKNGAAISLDIDPFDIGLQTGELALSLLKGGAPRKIPNLDPRKAHLHKNENVLRKLRLKM